MAVFCYLIGDENTKTGALLDPAFDTDRIVSEAQRLKYQITHIINTHGHPDHTAGNRALKAVTGAQILIHELDADRLGKVMSFRKKILTLSGATVVWPGHDYGPAPWSTIEHEQDSNPYIP